MKFILSLILIICILPSAYATSVRQVSPEVMESILTNPAVKHQMIVLAQNEDPKKKAEEEAQKAPSEVTPMPVYNGSGPNLNFGNVGSSEEAALVVFAVIGVVVVLAWVAYFPVMAYESITQGSGKYNFHHLAALNTNLVSGNDDIRKGYFGGVMYNFFLENKNDSKLQTGLGVESGYFNMNEKRMEKRRLEGGYWMAGPSLRISDNMAKGFLKLDLLGGSSFDRDLGLLTKAQVSFNFEDFGYLFGLNLGALHAHVKKNRGPADDITNTGLMFGISVGKSF